MSVEPCELLVFFAVGRVKEHLGIREGMPSSDARGERFRSKT